MNEQTEFIKIKNALDFQHNLDCVGDGPLDKGAFGMVVKAKCRKEGKSYAIKILPKKEDERKKYHDRELEALMTLNLSKESKRNVIEYFASWILQAGDVKHLCIQMELCSVSLVKFIQNVPDIIKVPDQPRFYQQIFRQILNGLVVIHSIHWVHRDIHPGNILIVHPNPKHIIDIHIKIADFGLARRIRVEPQQSIIGYTILPQLEKVSGFANSDHFRAPELKEDTYDFKVDVYSAGVVLYFISRYLEPDKWHTWGTEFIDLKKQQFDVKDRIHYKDDEKLSGLIKNLIQDDPKKRFSAIDAREYMFPTQLVPKDSNDATKSAPASQKKAVSFTAIDSQEQSRLCRLQDFTLFALKAEIQERMHVRAERQILKHEVMIHGCKIIHNEVDDDIDVHNIFTDAVEKGSYAVITVSEKADTPMDSSGL